MSTKETIKDKELYRGAVVGAAKHAGFAVKAVRQFMGRDCPGVNCNLYYDNKKVAEYVDDGSGAPAQIYWDNTDKAKEAKKMLDHVVDACPAQECEWMDKKTGKPWIFEPDDCAVIDELINEYTEIAELKRLCRTKTVTRERDENGDVQTFTYRVKFSPDIARQLREKFSDRLVEIINERFAK